MQTWMMDPVHEAASTAKRRRRSSKVRRRVVVAVAPARLSLAPVQSPGATAARSARAKELAHLSAESLKDRIEHTFEVAKEPPVRALGHGRSRSGLDACPRPHPALPMPPRCMRSSPI